MPMPLSEIIIVFAALSTAMSIRQSGLSATSAFSVRPLNFALSIASDAFDTSSLRKISFFE